MQKIFNGIVTSIKMQKTAVVRITSERKHPIYKKVIKKDKKVKADTGNLSLSLGDTVKIAETKPISKTKYFKVLEIIKK